MPRSPSAKALEKFETEFKKSFGADARRPIKTKPYEVCPTGSLTLDYATGVGGLVEGRVYEFWGKDAIGKTTFALLTAAEYQRKYPDRFVGFIDMEQTFDEEWGRKLGLDMERVYFTQPGSAEDVADMMTRFLVDGPQRYGINFGFIVLDSIGGMISKTELNKLAEEDTVGRVPKIVTRMVNKASVEVRKSGAIVVFINQVRANIGSYGADIDTPGGYALKHATTMKFQFRGGDTYKEKRGDEVHMVGRNLTVRLDRNKVAPPHRTATFALFNQDSKYGPIGVDRADEAATLGVRFGFIEQRGAWYVPPLFPDEKGVNGREKLLDWLREHPESVQDIRKRCIALRAGEVIPEMTGEDDGASE